MRPILLAAALFASPAVGWSQSDLEGRIAFFERKIRPVLVEHCYACHSQAAIQANQLQGGLLLDSRQAIRRGGDSGAAVVPGQPDESLLLSALRYESFEMPPQGQLPAEVVADFTKWIQQGALDPRDSDPQERRPGLDLIAGREHWAYQLPQPPAEPPVLDPSWADNKIDRFLQARLDQYGWLPANDAEPDVLLRRVYYDLIGLPPSPEALDRFLDDPSPRRYRRIVDQLLSSPRFGERWGRHWLDVARFGESNTLRGTVFGQAWRYRDWVVDAFNRDLPFDEFIVAQLAGDLLPAEDWRQARQQLTATTFLSLGNNNFENQDKEQLRMDVVDEQLETISRAFLAQTVACARCHDHKFDPIPTRDYYALAGIFRNTKTLEHANVSRWLEVPLPGDPRAQPHQYDTRVAQVEQKIEHLQKSLGVDSKKLILAKAVPHSLLPGIVLDDQAAIRQGSWTESTSSPQFVDNGYLHDMNSGQGQKAVIFTTVLPATGSYEVRASYSAGANRASNARFTVHAADRRHTTTVNQRQTPPINGLFTSLGTFDFDRRHQVRIVVSNDAADGHVIVDAVQFLKLGEGGASLADSGGLKSRATASAQRLNQLEKLKELTAQLEKLRAAAPEREMVMSVLEEEQIDDTHVHIRGNVHNLGARVARGFLQVAHYGPPACFTNRESGRRQLADWVASELNPLTARVAVNRLWHWLFGTGLVRTTDNFGKVGELPSHPELLDYLALEFQRDDWSTKSMLRKLVLSHAYRTSSRVREPARRHAAARPKTSDVENRLLWRGNRRRLEAESIRDAMLSVSGQLQLDMQGPTFPAGRKEDYDFHYQGRRRSIYIPVFRNALPEIFEAFDFADPSIVVGNRTISTVAPQALFMMNNPFVIDQAQRAAERLRADLPGANIAQRVERAYRLTLGRRPSDRERGLAEEYVRAAERGTNRDRWSELFQSLFSTLDFRYVD